MPVNSDTPLLNRLNLPQVADILIVDDCELNNQILKFTLEDDGHRVSAVMTGERAIACASTESPDLILLDLNMPGMSGLEILATLKMNPRTADIPVIMVSASNNDRDIVTALDLGAHDYVCKPVQHPILAARMRSALRLANALRQVKVANARLEIEANTDFLTELYNRRQFLKLSHFELTKALRGRRDFTLMMLDIDNFKHINDSYGHDVGDAVIQSLGKVLRENIRESDIAGRLGGEEFAVTLPDSNLLDGKSVAERIRQEFAETVNAAKGNRFFATISIGITAISTGDRRLHQLLKRADLFLYQAKETGKNKVLGGHTFDKNRLYA